MYKNTIASRIEPEKMKQDEHEEEEEEEEYIRVWLSGSFAGQV